MSHNSTADEAVCAKCTTFVREIRTAPVDSKQACALYKQFVSSCSITKESEVQFLVEQICQQAAAHHHFISSYAHLCVRLSGDFAKPDSPFNIAAVADTEPGGDSGRAVSPGSQASSSSSVPVGNRGLFKRLLISHCETVFRQHNEALLQFDPKAARDTDAYAAHTHLMLGNIRFVGELANASLLPLKAVASLAEELLAAHAGVEARLQCVVALFTAAGKSLEQRPASKPWFLKQLGDLRQLMDKRDTSVYIKGAIADLIHLQAADWHRPSVRALLAKLPKPHVTPWVRSVVDRVKAAVGGCRSNKVPWDVVPFGGAVNGFSNHDSDLDLTLVALDALPKENQITKLFHALAAILQRRGFSKVTKVLHARIPLLKFTDTRSGRQVDLTVENTLGTLNSQLLAQYAAYDPRIAQMGKLVKRWAHEEGLVGTRDGYLSSYAWVLMTVHYLQTTGTADTQPVAPNLQAAVSRRVTSGGGAVSIDGRQYDCRFATAAEAAAAAAETGMRRNTSDIKSLLQAFFSFFSTFDWEKNAVSIRLGNPFSRTSLHVVSDVSWVPLPANGGASGSSSSSSSSSTAVAAASHWVVEDPFELERNLAAGCTAGAKSRIREKMRVQTPQTITKLLQRAQSPNSNSYTKYTFARVFLLWTDTYDSVRADLDEVDHNAVLHFPNTPKGAASTSTSSTQPNSGRFNSCFVSFASHQQCSEFAALNAEPRAYTCSQKGELARWNVHMLHAETAHSVMAEYAEGFWHD